MNKSIMRLTLCFTAVFMVSQLFAFRADDPISGSAKTAASALKTIPPKTPTDGQKEAVKSLDNVQVEWDAKTGAPASIRGKDLAAKNLGGKGLLLKTGAGRNFAADSIAVMDRLTKAYRLHDAAKEFSAIKTQADELGFRHVRLDQVYKGLKVVGAEVIVHFNKAGKAYQVNGRYIPDININIKAGIDATKAVEAAQNDLAKMGKPAGTLNGSVELVIYARKVAPVLAYELTLVYKDEKAGAGNWRYWINARDGTIINRYNDIRKSAATISGNLNSGEGGASVTLTGDLSASIYYLRFTSRFWSIYDQLNSRTCQNSTATWGTSIPLRSEMSAAYNFDKSLNYFISVHSRNSFDNASTESIANVHTSGGTDNAYWDPNAKQFFFYPGSTFAELTVLDVCAHEFTHAVTEYSANLVYQNEPGALNESFSDVFGAAVEFYAQPDGRGSYPARTAGYADWLLGEDCTYTTADVALRDMRNPQRFSNPSKYHGTDWYYGSGDNGGVHYNSGVQNHFFYLLCEGGSGNNDGISYNFTGIGITNARAIAYRALTVYCTRDTDYAGARTAWSSAAQDLDASWVSTVQAAWAAVGVDSSTPTQTSKLRVQGLNNDFDGDDTGDYALFNYQSGSWYIYSSSAEGWLANGETFGSSSYFPVPGDYDGNGHSDVVVYSRSTANWMIYYIGTGVADTFQWGSYYCIPAPGDYDGDDKTDFALYNFVTGAWYIYSSLHQTMLANGELFGGYGYVPVPGDYNGGGQSDVVIYSEELALWLLYYTETGTWTYCDFSEVFGSYRYFVPAPGDYDGDGVTDFGLYDYMQGNWYVWSAVNDWLVYGYNWGNSNYRPVAGDFDGDAYSDMAVYSRSNGDWHFYYMGSDTSAQLPSFGGSQYIPITYWALYWYM
ncbi:M4 family metallopeptidase [Verrucomicrobiota bacterium]